MKTLLLYLSEDEQFDLEKITSILKNNLDKNSLKEDHLIGAILEGEFSYQNDFTLVRLSDSLETISLDGLGDASLKLALEIQKHYPKPIQAIDSDYTFDICLKNIESLSEFRQKVFNHSEAFYYKIDPSLALKINLLAEQKGINSEELINIWLRENIQKEMA